MSIHVIFTPESMSSSQYDEIMDRLQQAGAEAPKGRLHHVSYGSGDQLCVADVWESEEAFEHFGQTLMPILQEVGVDPGNPVISPVHNIMVG